MTEEYIPYHDGGWHGFVLKQWNFSGTGKADEWLAANPGETVVRYRSREVLRAGTPEDTVYVKRIYALTDAGMAGRDWGSWLKWYFRPSRAIGTWRISCDLLEHGFACAVPLAALRRRSSLGYPEDLFISRKIQGEELAEKIAGMTREDEVEALLRNTARQLAKFHAAGYVHGDCLLRNLALSPDQKIVYLDNDRTRRARWYNPFRNKKRNLAQLGYSILRITNCRRYMDAFLEEYIRAAKWPMGVEKERLVHNILNRYLLRMEQINSRKQNAQTP